jgi:archaellum component FlaF (FlaF/FlaG flagellin family)
MPAPAPAAQTPGAAKPKTSPVVWILAAVVGVFVLVGILIFGAGLFVAYKAKNAGFDSALAQKNPALAAAKVMASLNPDVEIVSVDEDKGLLTIRDKKSGKVLTMNADDVKNGKMTIKDESTGEKVTFGASSAAQLPSWLPSYPGSKPEGTFSASGSGNEGGMAHFKTSDAGSKVLAFYQDALKSGGFKITSTFTGDSGDAKGGLVSAEDTANGRTVMVTVSSSGEGTDVSLTYGTKH